MRMRIDGTYHLDYLRASYRTYDFGFLVTLSAFYLAYFNIHRYPRILSPNFSIGCPIIDSNDVETWEDFLKRL